MDEEILGTAYVNEDMPEDDKVPEDMEKEDNINTIEKNTIEKKKKGSPPTPTIIHTQKKKTK